MAADPLSLRVPAAMLNVRRQFYSQRVLEPDSPAYKASSDCEEFPEPVPIETIVVPEYTNDLGQQFTATFFY